METATARVAFITGGTGFVGRHLVRRLIADGWAVHILTRGHSDRSSLHEVPGITFHTYEGTLESIRGALCAARADVVFHLATCFVSQHTPDDLDAMLSANITLGAQLLEAMAVTKTGYLVNAGTSWQSAHDRDYSPVNLYAAMKQALEDLIAYYVEASELQAVTLRLFDTYGPDDPRGKLLQALGEAARNGSTLQMSPGEQILDLLYIDDAVNGFVQAADYTHTMATPEHVVFSLSSNNRHTLKQVVDIFSRVSNATININWSGRPYRDREVMIPWTTGTALPEWTAEIDLEEGIRRMLQKHV